MLFAIRFIKLSLALSILLYAGCNNGVTKPDSGCDDDTTVVEADTTWQVLGLGSETIQAFAVDPFNPDVIYAGSASDFSAGTTGSIFKSVNGGACWDTLMQGVTVRDIDIHPTNSNIVYVTAGINSLTSSGILKSTNGGQNWHHADSGIEMNWEEGPGVLAIDPDQPNRLYVGTSGIYGGDLYKSVNSGDSWQAIGPEDIYAVTAIAIDPQNPQTVYAGKGRLYKSSDYGQTWSRLSLPGVGIMHDVLVHPSDSNTIYVGAWWYGFFVSNDGGDNWQNFNSGLSDTTSIRKVIVSNPNIYVAANNRREGVVYKSNQTNYNWQQVGLETFPLGTMSLVILPEKRLIVGTKSRGVHHILD